jgi:hypothetical protein
VKNQGTILSLRSSFAISHGVDIVVALVIVGLAAPAWHHQMPRFQKLLVALMIKEKTSCTKFPSAAP